MPQQPRANQPYRQHDSGADEDAGLRPAMGEAVTVDHRTDGLAQIERGRMQRGGGAAGGLRKVGHMDLDAAVQEIEAETKQAIDGDLPDPWDMQRNQDKSGRGERAAGDP